METPISAPTPHAGYETAVLQWLQAALEEGRALLEHEPQFDEAGKMIAYVMGDQLDPMRPQALSTVVDNRVKHVVLQTVSALTDMKSLFGVKTANPQFHDQGTLLDRLGGAWWVNAFCDMKLADVVRYAVTVGMGYAELTWDPAAADGQGDMRIIPRDPRDVIPIRPTLNGSVQEWEGVIVQESKSINELRARFPDAASKLTADDTGTFASRTWTRAKKLMSTVISPSAVDMLTRKAPTNRMSRIPTATLYTIYLKDRSVHEGSTPRVMGDPDTTWAYTVYAKGSMRPDGTRATADDAKLYPRGRLILATEKVILYDGPNPFWHGRFPIARLQLDPWPWSFWGGSIVKDLKPLQDFVNDMLNGFADYTKRVLRPSIVGDKKALPESVWQRLDMRQAGQKLRTNAALGKTVDTIKLDALDPMTFQIFGAVVNEIDTLSGTANLSALTQLNQLPGADSVEKLVEMLTPILRTKARLIEAFLREMGDMAIGNFFQFYTLPRRVAMLGDAGIAMEDFDFDPGSLVPSMSERDEGYLPQLDANKTRAERAIWHRKNFTFTITPNSLLAISQMSRKLLYLQLWRGGLMDPWSLFEVLEIPNGGAPPLGANTIIERILVAGMMGLTGTVSPAGRKATGQEPPQIEQKTDEGGFPRQTVSETGSGGG